MLKYLKALYNRLRKMIQNDQEQFQAYQPLVDQAPASEAAIEPIAPVVLAPKLAEAPVNFSHLRMIQLLELQGEARRALSTDDDSKQANETEILEQIKAYIGNNGRITPALKTLSNDAEAEFQMLFQNIIKSPKAFAFLITNPADARALLQQPFRQHLSAVHLAKIFYEHRADNEFMTLFARRKDGEVNWGNVLIAMKNQAEREGQEELVFKIIRKSATLCFAFYCVHHEIKPAELDRMQLSATDDPYEILGVGRDAGAGEVHPQLAKKLFPIQGSKVSEYVGYNQFIKMYLAYTCLKKPDQRQAWDEAHPVNMSIELA